MKKIALMCMCMMTSMNAAAVCSLEKLAGVYSGSGTFRDVSGSTTPNFFTGRFVLNPRGSVVVPFWRVTADGEIYNIAASGNWNVNTACVGSIKLDVTFSNNSSAGQRVRIFFTAAGSGDDIILDGIYEREIGPSQSGIVTFRKRNL